MLKTVEHYLAALQPGDGGGIARGEVRGLGIMLQNAATAAEWQIAARMLPPMEDAAKTALDSLLTMHGPLILATGDGASLSARAQDFEMTTRAAGRATRGCGQDRRTA